MTLFLIALLSLFASVEAQDGCVPISEDEPTTPCPPDEFWSIEFDTNGCEVWECLTDDWFSEGTFPPDASSGPTEEPTTEETTEPTEPTEEPPTSTTVTSTTSTVTSTTSTTSVAPRVSSTTVTSTTSTVSPKVGRPTSSTTVTSTSTVTSSSAPGAKESTSSTTTTTSAPTPTGLSATTATSTTTTPAPGPPPCPPAPTCTCSSTQICEPVFDASNRCIISSRCIDPVQPPDPPEPITPVQCPPPPTCQCPNTNLCRPKLDARSQCIESFICAECIEPDCLCAKEEDCRPTLDANDCIEKWTCATDGGTPGCPDEPVCDCDPGLICEPIFDDRNCIEFFDCACKDEPSEPAETPFCVFEPRTDANECIVDWECLPKEVEPTPPTRPPLTVVPTPGPSPTPTPNGLFNCPPPRTPEATPLCNWLPTINRWTGCTTGWICGNPNGRNTRPCTDPAVPKADPACVWTPVIDAYGCTVDFDCYPVYEDPPEEAVNSKGNLQPCPIVRKPQPKPGCTWTVKIHPSTSCIAHYYCREDNEPIVLGIRRSGGCPRQGEEGFVPSPFPVPECQWKALINDKGCIGNYTCTRTKTCPTLGPRPPPRFNCNQAPIIDPVTNCKIGWGCRKPEDGIAIDDRSYSFDFNNFPEPFSFPHQQCDPEELYSCSGTRESYQWGCCLNYYGGGRAKWNQRGCFCDKIQGRCVMTRTLNGQNQWSYCIPKDGYDCYANYFDLGNRCSSVERRK